MNRRSFLLASAAFPVGCALRGRSAGPGQPSPTARQPAVGQSWRYAKRDYFTRAMVDTQVDSVAVVGRTINIDSRTEGSAAKYPQGSSFWGLKWLRQYTDPSRPAAVLPSEVQSPWGMVLVDPHWNQVEVFKTPVPLWPTVLQPGWRAHVNTRYKTSDDGDGDGLPWEQTMKAEAWETITVPAGSFKTLRYINLVNFRSSDPGRDASVRRETIWFAPDIGRWAARESSGSFYLDDSVVDQPYSENSYRWELLEWT